MILADRIAAEEPRLRRYALVLTRNRVRADDLVQDALLRGVSKQHLWQEGTNLRAWLFTIMHNLHAAGLSTAAGQETGLRMRDLVRAIARLPEEQRTVLLLVGAAGMNYEEAAIRLGVPEGTVRSRLWRGRQRLREDMRS